MIESTDILALTLSEEDIAFCNQHAALMCKGAKTYSFKEGKNQSQDVYAIGKIGELAVSRYFAALQEEGRLTVVHEPFREDYSKFNWNDDFIVETKQGRTQIEVRAKGRNVPPRLDFECCTDCIKPTLAYLFVSFDRKTNQVYLLGKAAWTNFQQSAYISAKGTANNNFEHKVTEFNIKIRDLSPLVKPQNF